MYVGEISQQYGVPAIVIEPGDTGAAIAAMAHAYSAVIETPDGIEIVVDDRTDPTRQVGPETYSERALMASFK